MPGQEAIGFGVDMEREWEWELMIEEGEEEEKLHLRSSNQVVSLRGSCLSCRPGFVLQALVLGIFDGGANIFLFLLFWLVLRCAMNKDIPA